MYIKAEFIRHYNRQGQAGIARPLKISGNWTLLVQKFHALRGIFALALQLSRSFPSNSRACLTNPKS
jgi:hypothetical protein